MTKSHLYAVAGLLAVAGLGLFAYKAFVLGFPLQAGASAGLWNVEVRIAFTAQRKPAKISLFIPRNTRRHAVIDENFISRGFGLITSTTEDGNRRVVWSVRLAEGRQTLYYRAKVHKVQITEPPAAPTPQEVSEPQWESPYRESALALVKDIRAKSADAETFVGELFKRIHDPKPDETITLLFGIDAEQEDKIQTAVKVLQLAGIPARTVHGIRLREVPGEATRVHWAQIHDGSLWRSVHPVTGELQIPNDYFAWWRGPQPLVQAEGVRKLRYTLSASPDEEEAIRAAFVGARLEMPRMLEFSLFSLPLETQAVYRILLLVPLGAFLLVLLRNVVGVKTFGTFMPILIALAFRETQLLWGIVLFSMVVALGLTVRFYLEHLKLLLVPRLASVLIVVIVLMAIMSVVSHRLGLERGLSVALFPMVILTMTIERMCIVWDERGAAEALQQGLGSLSVAALTYLVITESLVEHLFFVFPELLLVLLAGTLLLGRYSGFRLLELRRFRALAQDHPP